jgi:SAM-dependent methyltransferase
VAREPQRERDSLLEVLRGLDRTAAPQWVDSLEPRKRAELAFHDSGRERNEDGTQRNQAGANRKYYTTVTKSQRHVNDWMQSHVRGRVFLDYACGGGAKTILAAKQGAVLAIGLDISPVSIQNARGDAAAAGVSENTYFLQADCENTRLPDDSIDVMLCGGMLHHLDLNRAFPEMRRILKPGGVCLGVEALGYNPLIRLYRRLTPHLRTEWEKEHILSLKELRLARRFFEVRNVRFWHLFSIAAAFLNRTPLFRPALALGNLLDAVVLRIPLIRRLAWQFTFELHKSA